MTKCEESGIPLFVSKPELTWGDSVWTRECLRASRAWSYMHHIWSYMVHIWSCSRRHQALPCSHRISSPQLRFWNKKWYTTFFTSFQDFACLSAFFSLYLSRDPPELPFPTLSKKSTPPIHFVRFADGAPNSKSFSKILPSNLNLRLEKQYFQTKSRGVIWNSIVFSQ